jgi:ParB/RepB/Spo0J family partition protein
MDSPNTLDPLVRSVPFRTLEAGPNPRQHDKAYLKTLAASIKALGLLQPLGVVPIDGGKRGQVRYGNGRLAALKLLKTKPETPIPIVLVRDDDEAMVQAAALAENRVRAPMNPLEECDAFCALIDQGKSVDEVAAWFAVTDRFVRQRLQLRQLAPAFRSLVVAGEITLDLAGSLAILPAERQAKVLADAKQRGWKPGGKGDYSSFPDWLIHNAIRDRQVEAKHALFDVEAAGIRIDRDLFDDKDEGKVLAEDVERFLALQTEAAKAKGPAVAEKNGCAAWIWDDDIEDQLWTLGYRYVPRDKDGNLKIEPGHELVAVGDLLSTGEPRWLLQQRPIGGKKPKPDDDDDEDRERDPLRDYAERHADRDKPEDQEKVGQSLENAIREVQALIAAGQLLADPTLALRLAIVQVIKAGRYRYAAHLGSIVPGHPSVAAESVRQAFKVLSDLGGSKLCQGAAGDAKAYGSEARNLHSDLIPARLYEGVMAADESQLPQLLAAAMVLAMDPCGSLVQAVRKHSTVPEGKFYCLGEYELGKLTKDQLLEQAKAAGLEGVDAKTRKEVVKAIMAKGLAARDAGSEAPILPILAKARNRTGDW